MAAVTPGGAPRWVLGGGLWLWYVLGLGPCEPARVQTDARGLGATGVILHAVGTARPQLDWLARAGAALDGLGVCVAIGSRGPARWRDALADPAVDALRAGRRVMLDAEGAWDAPAGVPAMRQLVDRVRAAVPDAVGRVLDCSWWAPDLHRGFPTAILGELCATRAPQCYPAVDTLTKLQADGAAARCLAHARGQYPQHGSPAAAVVPTVRGYARTARDVCKLALDEPHQLVYLGSNRNALSAQARAGLVAAKRVRDAGGVLRWQTDHGLTADGVVGPKTLASLGL